MTPPEAREGHGLGTVTGQLLDALQDCDADTAGAWGVYAAGLAAFALRHGWGPGVARGPESRASWSDFAWLLACVAWVLVRRARSYEWAGPSWAA